MDQATENAKKFFTPQRVALLVKLSPLPYGPVNAFGRTPATIHDPARFIKNLFTQLENSQPGQLPYRAALHHLRQIRKAYL